MHRADDSSQPPSTVRLRTEGARFWLHVFTELKNRGVEDVFIAVCDGLKGLPEAINTTWEQTVVQQCGSGVTACHNLLAMEHAGLAGSRVYAPSWSGWIGRFA